MIYSIYPTFDTTLYEQSSSLNSGTDQILELSHTIVQSSSKCNSRILLKFDLSSIEENIGLGKLPMETAKYYLQLRTAEVREIPQEYTIYAYPVSSSWSNGTGKFLYKPIITDGTSWEYRFSKENGTLWEVPPATSSFVWDVSSSSWVDSSTMSGSITAQVTSSYATNPGGATWWLFDGGECTQSFSFQNSDLFMDVTPMVNKWITGSGKIKNDGMILKFEDYIESTYENKISLKFFSVDSNTIYVPRLHVVWDNSIFTTGSLSPVSTENTSINVKLNKFYAQSEKAKIRITANKKYPIKHYTTQSYYIENYYLPSSSYYEIRDAHTDEVILPFDLEGTKISCDGTSNYFHLWMDSFQPERFYRVVVKSETDGGDTVQIFDNNYYFKVTR